MEKRSDVRAELLGWEGSQINGENHTEMDWTFFFQYSIYHWESFVFRNIFCHIINRTYRIGFLEWNQHPLFKDANHVDSL